MLRAPGQQAAAEHHHGVVGEESGDADDGHAGDDDLGAGKLAGVHDHGAEAGLDAGHLADDDHYPGEAEAQRAGR